MKLFYFTTLNETDGTITLDLRSMDYKGNTISEIKEEASEFEILMKIKDFHFHWAPKLKEQLNYIQAFMN